jgi:hypothetical protein
LGQFQADAWEKFGEKEDKEARAGAPVSIVFMVK